jgi:hypothetical protein
VLKIHFFNSLLEVPIYLTCPAIISEPELRVVERVKYPKTHLPGNFRTGSLFFVLTGLTKTSRFRTSHIKNPV